MGDYVDAADFSTKSKKVWTEGLTLTEAQGGETFLETVISHVELVVNQALSDDFEPAVGDADVVLEVTGTGGRRLYLPRRCRSVTTVKTRSATGTLTVEDTDVYRLKSSLNSTGTALGDEPNLDFLDVVRGQTLSCGYWPIGIQTVQVTGKFGWAACPTDIKRLVALLVHDYIVPQNGKLRAVERLQTRDATYTFLPADETLTGIRPADDILKRYQRRQVFAR